MANLRATLGLAAGLTAATALTSGTADARDLSTFGDGVEGSHQIDLNAVCPDVVVIKIPYCTDECGQFLVQERQRAMSEAFAVADRNGDGHTLAYIAGYTSRVAPTDYNQALSERRVNHAARLAQSVGAQVVYTAPFGESRARGAEFDDFAEDRLSVIFLTESTQYMGVTQNGTITPRPGVNVSGFSAPSCNSHLRNGDPALRR